MIEAGPPADLVTSYASLLPIKVMCELLDIPVRDQASLIAWTGIFFDTGVASTQERTQAGMAFFVYVRDLVAARRERPGSGIVDELITACDSDGAMTPGELYQMISALLIGGQENTSAILARGLFTLLRQPDLYRLLARDPGRIPAAVEEMLRYEVASEGAFLRVATSDVELTAGTVTEGSAVQVSIPSANRDGGLFSDPAIFDPSRAVNQHLTFGAGAVLLPGRRAGQGRAGRCPGGDHGPPARAAAGDPPRRRALRPGHPSPRDPQPPSHLVATREPSPASPAAPASPGQPRPAQASPGQPRPAQAARSHFRDIWAAWLSRTSRPPG